MKSADSAADRASVLPSGGAVIAVAIGVMNVATYGFTIVAARLLGPQQYGALAAVMNLLLVITVAQLALQATAARRIAATPGDTSLIEDGVRRVTWRAALALGVVLVLLAPVVDAVLRLDSLLVAALVGVIAVPLTVMGGQAGILQGERRWRPLAMVYAALGLPRLVIGVAFLAWRPDELTAVVAVLIAAFFPVAVGWWALRDRGHRRGLGSDRSGLDHGTRSLGRESLRHSYALLGFFAVTNIDVVMARNVLDGHDAGLYAGGLILTKAVLFLPQFVVVLAFPDLAAEGRRRALRGGLALVGALGVLAVLGAWLLSPLALLFVGGSEYAEVQDRLWLFAVLGTVLSMLQLCVYAVIAGSGGRATWLLWIALGVIVGGAQFVGSLAALLILVAVVDGVLLLVLLLAARSADGPQPLDRPLTAEEHPAAPGRRHPRSV